MAAGRSARRLRCAAAATNEAVVLAGQVGQVLLVVEASRTPQQPSGAPSTPWPSARS
jgi:hypothetical protein